MLGEILVATDLQSAAMPPQFQTLDCRTELPMGNGRTDILQDYVAGPRRAPTCLSSQASLDYSKTFLL